MIKTEIAVNLKKLLFEYEISATELAQCIDIPQPTIHRIIVGKSKQPRNETINKIADYFRIDPDKLLSADFNVNNHLAKQQRKISANNTSDIFEIPIIDLQQTASTIEANQNINRHILSTRDINPKCFAVYLNDSSMEPIFTKNNLIIFDPDKTPTDRDYILVKLDNSIIFVFRQLIINGGDKFLKPLNPELNGFPLKLLQQDDLILGVAVESRQEFI